MVIAPILNIEWDESETLPDTARGMSGFGSTGLNKK
jgi:dUTPase